MALFYGRKTDGIFQNWDEVNSYVNKDGELLQPNARPGDVRSWMLLVMVLSMTKTVLNW